MSGETPAERASGAAARILADTATPRIGAPLDATAGDSRRETPGADLTRLDPARTIVGAHAERHLRRRDCRVRCVRGHTGRAPGQARRAVAIVEGGPRVNTRTDFNTHAMPFDFPNRQIPTMRPGKVGFDSERSRGVGGKTMLWNAVALRLSQRDFKGRTFEGAGEDWPLDYKDIAPYYDAIEREVGVCGNLDGLEDLPDGIFLPPVPLKCSDEIMQRAAQSLGGKVIHVRKATLTVATSTRLACHFCGNCMAGCDVVAKYNSADVHIAPAEKSGQVTVFPDCIVREVLVSGENRATGVRYLHRVHQREGEVRGRAVVLACACVQSIALLLMSTSAATRPAWPTRAGSSGGTSSRTSPAESSACSRGCGASRRSTTRGSSITATCRPSCTQQKARLCAQLRRTAQLPEPAIRRLGEVGERLRRVVQGVGEGGVSGVRPVHAVRRDAAERAVVRRSRSRADRQVRAARGAAASALGQRTKRRCSTTWWAGAWRCSRRPARRSCPCRTARRPTTSSGDAAWGAIRGPRSSTRLPHARRAQSVCRGWQRVPSASEKNPTHTIMALAARAAEHIADRLRRGDL